MPNAALLALAAICVLSVDGDYTAPKQDSRAAADDRSTLSRIAGINAALPRAGITFRRQKTCASPRLPIKTLSLGGCKGGYSLSEEEFVSQFGSPEAVGSSEEEQISML